MATLYIHGGMQKTGSTAIQQFLAKNRAALEEQGVAYPDFSDIWDPGTGGKNAYWLVRRLGTDEVRKEAVARIAELAKTHERIIISEERLWKHEFCKDDFWPFLAELFKPYNIVIKVVVYLRRQDEYLYSNWAQSIKSTVDVPFKTLSFSEYIEAGYHKKQPLDYQKELGRIEKAIGRENVFVRTYERGQFTGEGHTLTSDFLKIVGLDDSGSYAVPEKITNVSLKDAVLEAKRYLNRVPEFTRKVCLPQRLKSYDPYMNALLKAQNQMREEGLLKNRTGFPYHDRISIMEQYTDSNAAVAKRYLGRNDGILFYEPIPSDEDADKPFTTEELIEVCGRVIIELGEELVKQQNLNNKLRNRIAKASESNEKLRSRVAEKDKKIKSLQQELDSPIFKIAVNKILKKFQKKKTSKQKKKDNFSELRRN